MNKENYINLDNQMKLFSRGVYKKNKNILPENSQYILSLDDKNSGFYGEAFLKTHSNYRINIIFKQTRAKAS